MILDMNSFKRIPHDTGIFSYRRDIVYFLLPKLRKVITDNGVIFTDTHYDFFDITKYPTAHTVVYLRHSDDIEFLRKLPYEADLDISYRVITHYQYFVDTIRKETNFISHFIPMSIDPNRLPKPKTDKQQKFLYYQNEYDFKLPMLKKLQSMMKFDILSYGYFNGDMSIKHSHKKCLDILNDYQYVITTGRGVLEAIKLGCKVLNVGRNYTGAIYNEQTFDQHHKYNFNTYEHAELTSDQLHNDIHKLRHEYQPISTDKIHMENYVDYYIDACK